MCKPPKTRCIILRNLPCRHRAIRRSRSKHHVLPPRPNGTNKRWLGANVAPHYKRSTAIGFQQTLANTAGVVAGQIYVKTQAPGYITGHAVSLGGMAMANIGYWILMAHLKLKNNKKERMRQELEKEGKSTDVGEGDLSINFMYHL